MAAHFPWGATKSGYDYPRTEGRDRDVIPNPSNFLMNRKRETERGRERERERERQLNDTREERGTILKTYKTA